MSMIAQLLSRRRVASSLHPDAEFDSDRNSLSVSSHFLPSLWKPSCLRGLVLMFLQLAVPSEFDLY
jgi:hypothetical protein